MTHTQVFAIFGHPISHSRSPAMHNRAFAELGLDAVYVPFDVSPEALADAVRGLRALGIAGANVTLPHKTAVMAHLDHVSTEAQAIGAVNTLYWEDGKLCGDNTDAPGLSRSLEEAGVQLTGQRVTILGAGGAARAAAVGLAGAGAARVTVAARRPQAAQALVQAVRPALGTCVAGATGTDHLAGLFAETDILVQSTSATLGSHGEQAQAFAQSLPIHVLPSHATVTDLVYTPRVTTVMQIAQERGLHTVDGLGMLLYQGVLAFERWTKTAAPVDIMRAVLES